MNQSEDLPTDRDHLALAVDKIRALQIEINHNEQDYEGLLCEYHRLKEENARLQKQNNEMQLELVNERLDECLTWSKRASFR
jgi:hypothetical protein